MGKNLVELFGTEPELVFFDFDGVLSKYQTMESSVGIYPESDWVRWCIEVDDVFKHGGPSKTMQEVVSTLGTNRVAVLSVAETSFEQKQKLEVLKEHYPEFDENAVYFVAKSEYKKMVIQSIYNKHYKYKCHESKIFVVEDSLSVIEDIETNSKFKCKHISYFMD